MSAIESNKKIAFFAMGAILVLVGGALPTASATSHPVTAFTSPNAQSFGFFGTRVGESGTGVVVGSPLEAAGGFEKAGHVYIFSGTGSLIATLTSPNAQFDGEFGQLVAVSETSVVVGAPFETAGGFSTAGHVYIFSISGSLVSALTSPNAQGGGGFGLSVAVSRTSVVVGSPQETAGGFSKAGHVYIFSSTGSLTATFTSPNAQSGGAFGTSVTVSDTSVVVGAPGETAGGFHAGHAYIFSNTGSLIATLTSPDAQGGGEFGLSVAVNGTGVVVGAPQEAAGGLSTAGHVYIFSSTGSLVSTLTSPNAQFDGEFGFSVAVSNTSVVVGAFGEAARGFVLAGHVYIFSSSGSLVSTLTSPSAQSAGIFGFSVAVSNTSVVVGAPSEAARGFVLAGHAYLFVHHGHNGDTDGHGG